MISLVYGYKLSVADTITIIKSAKFAPVYLIAQNN